MKNEINRIRNIVVSISTGNVTSKPKIIPPLNNAQTMADKHNRKINKSIMDTSSNVKTKQSYENFRSSNKESASYAYFNNKESDNDEDEQAPEMVNQRSLTNLKASAHHKRSGILKFNTSVYNSANVSIMADGKEHNTTTTSITNMLNSEGKLNNLYRRSSRRQVRISEPKIKLDKMSDEERAATPTSKLQLTHTASPFVPKNADNRVVPGALRKRPIDFSKVIEDAVEQGDDTAPKEVEEIAPSDVHAAEPYFEYFEKDTVKNLFSRHWQNKEEGYKTMANEIKSLLEKSEGTTEDSGGHMVSFKKNKQDCLKLIINSVERGLNDKIIHVKLRACELFEIILDDQSDNHVQLKELDSLLSNLVDSL